MVCMRHTGGAISRYPVIVCRRQMLILNLPIMITTLTGSSFIGFSRSTGTQPCGHAVNPATGEALAPIYLSATSEEVEQAMALAAAAFPVYSNLPGKTRAAFLRKIAEKSSLW